MVWRVTSTCSGRVGTRADRQIPTGYRRSSSRLWIECPLFFLMKSNTFYQRETMNQTQTQPKNRTAPRNSLKHLPDGELWRGEEGPWRRGWRRPETQGYSVHIGTVPEVWFCYVALKRVAGNHVWKKNLGFKAGEILFWHFFFKQFYGEVKTTLQIFDAINRFSRQTIYPFSLFEPVGFIFKVIRTWWALLRVFTSIPKPRRAALRLRVLNQTYFDNLFIWYSAEYKP